MTKHQPIYETWGTATGRGGIQRTLDPASAEDRAFLDAVTIIDEDGTERHPSIEEANAMGMRRVVASRNILTGELKVREELPVFVVRAR